MLELSYILTFVAAVFGTYGTMWITKLTGKQSREAHFEEFRMKVMANVKEGHDQCLGQLAAAQQRITVLEQREARLYIIETCLMLAIGELRRTNPDSITIQLVTQMLSHCYPSEEKEPEWLTNLMNKLSHVA